MTATKNDQPLENSLKQLLLIQFNYYFEQEMSWEQKRATLVCITVLHLGKLEDYLWDKVILEKKAYL